VADARQVGRSARWFPLVGAILGAISAGALWLALRVFPGLLAAVLVVALQAALTGALHQDGLADTADGFGSGAACDDVLRIMRDHAIGSYGATALVLDLALKVAAISAMSNVPRVTAALVMAPILGRWSAVLLGATQPYARESGSPVKFIGRLELAVATITALAIAAALDIWRGPVAMAGVAGLMGLWAWRCRRRIGGITGDTIGAGVEFSECLVLLLFVAIRATPIA